jgi:hypothetical protein
VRRVLSIWVFCPIVILLLVGGVVYAANLHETQLRWAAQSRWSQVAPHSLGPEAQAVHTDFQRCLRANDHESLARAINNYDHQSSVPFWQSYTPSEIKGLLDGVEVDCTTSLIRSVPSDQRDARTGLVTILLANRYLVAPRFQNLVLLPAVPAVQEPTPSQKAKPARRRSHRPARAAVTGSI